jgi:hypothetical protein
MSTNRACQGHEPGKAGVKGLSLEEAAMEGMVRPEEVADGVRRTEGDSRRPDYRGVEQHEGIQDPAVPRTGAPTMPPGPGFARLGGAPQGVHGLIDGLEEVVCADQFEDCTTPEVAVDEM